MEGHCYFQLESRDREAQDQDEGRCATVRGVASYYHVEAGDELSPSAAWTCRHPLPWTREKHRVAFRNGVLVLRD